MTHPRSIDLRPTRRALLSGLGVAAVLPSLAGSASAAVDPAAVFADSQVPVLGNPEGDVAVAMWFDYQCPYCKKVEPVLMDIVKADGKIAVLLKDWPIFGAVSETAARMTFSARRQDRLGAVHEGLMAIEGRPTPARLDAVLAAVKIDRSRLDADIKADKPTFDALVGRNNQQALGFGFAGTPAFVIGSFVFGGVLDADGFRQAIADARRR